MSSKKKYSDLNISQADLCRICFGQSSQSDRVIVSRWLSGAKPIPRWLPQLLQYYRESNFFYAKMTKPEAIKIVNEVSSLLADNSDYDNYLKPKLEKLLKFINANAGFYK